MQEVTGAEGSGAAALTAQVTTVATLIRAVQQLYERYPYPHYPLLARPRWQEGYLAHSLFAQRLALDLGGSLATATTKAARATGRLPAAKPAFTVLIGGSGEILPYIVRRWEPFGHRVISVDLSARSLRRARWRLATSLKPSQFWRGDLDLYLTQLPGANLSHIDAYGVLHHMPNPSATLAAMRQKLAPGGTARIMVYNTEARSWIHAVQRVFAVLGLTTAELSTARALLTLASAAAPEIAARVAQLGEGTMRSDTRFCDTFLHPREARLKTETWFKQITAAGFATLGLFDRYGELDDLPNPLWRPPAAADIAARASDGRFENNLELFLVRASDSPRRSGPSDAQPQTIGQVPKSTRASGPWLFPYLLQAPPRSWFSYQETADLGLGLRLQLWRAHLAWVLRSEVALAPKLLRSLPTPALARLARIGALLPGQIADAGLRAALTQPLCTAMDVPELPEPSDLRGTNVERRIHELAALLPRPKLRAELALRRLAGLGFTSRASLPK